MRHADVVRSALARVAGRCESTSDVAWRPASGTPDDLVLDVRLDGDWLSVVAPLVAAALDDDLLALEAACPGAARVVIAPGGMIAIAADVALDAAVDTDRRVVDACRDVARGWRDVQRGAPADDTPIADTQDSDDDLFTRCRASGWPATARGAEIAVDLDVSGAFHQALVTCEADLTTRTGVTLGNADAAAASSPCGRAVALLLLRTAGAVRLVRAGRGADDRPCFATTLASPSAAELAHAFAALSVACRLAAAEAAALHHDPHLAEIYLRAWNDAALRRAA